MKLLNNIHRNKVLNSRYYSFVAGVLPPEATLVNRAKATARQFDVKSTLNRRISSRTGASEREIKTNRCVDGHVRAFNKSLESEAFRPLASTAAFMSAAVGGEA